METIYIHISQIISGIVAIWLLIGVIVALIIGTNFYRGESWFTRIFYVVWWPKPLTACLDNINDEDVY